MKNKIDSKFLFASVLIVLCVFSRFLPIAPNFSPIMAVALFSGAFFANRKLALLIPIVAMFISDLVIGLHSTMFAVYASFGIIALLGMKIRTITAKSVLLNSLAGAVIFFVITNLAVFAAGWYGYTVAGLVSCFEMAIPFFRYTLASSVAYSAVLFYGFYLSEKYLLQPAKATK